MQTRYAFLVLTGWLGIADIAEAQITAIQSIEWIARDSTGVDMWAYVAPDGDTITYSRTLDGRTWELLVTNRRGQAARPFLSASPAVSLTRGAWSRPHRRLAFTGGGSGDSDTAIYVADATGREVKRVPAQGVSTRIAYPSWMPDGRSVVVVDFGAPAGSTLYRIDVATGRSEALTTPAEFLVGMPSVSPDGQLIAFAGQPNRGAAYDQTRNQIWLLPIGGRPREVSAGQGRQPDWSPDGRWLAFTSSRGDSAGRHAVFIVGRNGENLTQLTDYASNAQHPVWSPDGTWLVFSAQTGERSDVFGLARITVPKALR
jgi:Tol biopolymer transport system component